ncbi:PE domain-containing protein [Nocardia sp. CNY236]|uniref:PE domain-containing protein n=1 Tax=Nocardia sp. CNY236 TaxID=1169152 RepID=UPI00040A687C|nr:PE domain-containing protein [Nocardia sp. CNY236]
MAGHVLIAPDTILAAATELDLVAERLAAVAAATAPATHVVPAGAEEVSRLSARHLNTGATSHDRAIAQAILECHHAAATLRAQVTQHVAGDMARAADVIAIHL